MRAASSLLGATAAAVVFAACGSGTSPAPSSPASEWTVNATGVIEQLRADTIAASDGDSRASARAALRDESRLYGLLVAYSDFGGCRHMVAAVGNPPRGSRVVVLTLAHACASLQRAAALFTRAASKSDASALLAAARAVRATAPLLDRAELELRSAAHATMAR
jgi:hypothetical protein